jgi:UDP-GlcNAc:undecaprenyl-phosphate GlcNAc-1-phosphate transferase
MPSVGLTIATIYFVSLLLSYFFVLLILKTPLVQFFIDKPGLRRMHQRVIPRIGGVAILMAFIILLLVWRYLLPWLPALPDSLFSAFMFVCFSILIIGLADDMVIFKISNKAKFFGEVLIACEIVFFVGIYLNKIHLLGFDITLGWIGIPISIFWLVGVTNAVNIIDGLDGLAGSIMMVTFGTIALLAGIGHDMPILIVAVLLAGLTSGFLLNNISPARVFLGDTGALLVGMICAVLSIYIVTNPEHKLPVLIAPLLVGFPILDVFVAMGRRFFKQIFNRQGIVTALKMMTVADNEHIHHRLVYRGLSHTETVTILFLFQVIVCMCAIIAFLETRVVSITSLVALLLLSGWLLVKLDFMERIVNALSGRKNRPKTYNDIIGVLGSRVLLHSLQKFDQNTFSFDATASGDVVSASVNYSAVVLEHQPGTDIDEIVKTAGSVYMSSTCPAIIITDPATIIPDYIKSWPSETSLYIMRNPVYVPVLLTELTKLVKRRSGKEADRVFNETRLFYRLVATNEEVQ